MATTTTDDLIIPEVWADTIQPLILGNAVMAQLAEQDDQLAGRPGDTVIFPKWGYIGDAERGTENVPMDFSRMSMTDSRASIVEAVKGVEITDQAKLAAISDPNAEAQRQIAIAIARKIDTDLIAAALYTHTNGGASDPEPTTAPLTVTGTADRFGWGSYVGAVALLGDEYDLSEMKGIALHSAQYASLLQDPNFLSADKVGAGNGVIQRGFVGSIGTVPVVITDRLPVDTSGTDPVYTALIIRRGGLALKYKRRVLIETDRDVAKRTDVITANVHYATKRTNDRGVIVVKTKALADA